jgi:hypothetical protein
LTGTLPREFSRVLGRLKHLDLSRNSLSGTIPAEWALAPDLLALPATQDAAGEALNLNLGNNR